MTFYQELQLNQAGSKALIRASESRKEKLRHTAVYLFKILLTVGFCTLFVTLFSLIFGTENSVAGVVILLTILTFRQADFGIHTPHGAAVMLIFYAILCIGPRAACALPPGYAFIVNFACILTMMVLGCFNVIMCNQFTLVLGYLLLIGYDVTGDAYVKRLEALVIGAVISTVIFWYKHRHIEYEKKFSSIFKELDITSERTMWQVRLTLAVSTAMLIAGLLGIPRAMWIGIAVMSIMQPSREGVKQRVRLRAPGNILGGALFLILYTVLPGDVCSYIGIIGGIGVGLSATYGWQAVFNSFGGAALAVPLFGAPGAVLLRIINNTLGSLYAFVFDSVCAKVSSVRENAKENSLAR